MIGDIGTVIWKEWREIVLQQGSRRGGMLMLFIFVGFLGILLPLQSGQSWLDSAGPLFFVLWEPLFLVSAVIADSFAGERERHTLETLLASRLPDRAILFGKVAAGVAYGWGLTLIALLLGLVTENLTQPHSGILLYSAQVGIGGVVLSLLTAGFAASSGVLISLRAPTVRQAQQTMNVGFIILTVVPFFIYQALTATTRLQLVNAIRRSNTQEIVIIAALVLIALDGALLLAALARFRRARLVLD